MRDREKQRAAWRKYKAAHYDELRAKRHARYRENRDKELKRMTRWREDNRDKLRAIWREHDAQPGRKARKSAREKTPEVKAKRLAYRKKNPRTEYHKAHELIYKERRKELHIQKQANDPQYRIRRSLRANLKNAIKEERRGGSAINNLGCSIAELKLYLERQWMQGMCWDNFGRLDALHRTWQIDHITPLSSFDLTDPKQVAEACHYTNLAPLWAIDNRRKANKTMSRLEGIHV